MGKRRAVVNYDRVLDWMARTPAPAQREAMLVWLKAVAIEPEMCTHATWEREDNGRTISGARVPGTDAIVTFLVSDVPARVILVLAIIDDPTGELPPPW